MPSILVIEDDPSTIEIISATLSTMGDITMLHTATGEEALRMVEEHLPDLILTDLRLPDTALKGWDIIERLKQDSRFAHIPIIAVSASGGEHLMKALKLGANDYLEKPFAITKLRRMIQQYLAG